MLAGHRGQVQPLSQPVNRVFVSILLVRLLPSLKPQQASQQSPRCADVNFWRLSFGMDPAKHQKLSPLVPTYMVNPTASALKICALPLTHCEQARFH